MNRLLTQASLLEKAVLSISGMAMIFPAGERRNPGEIYPATISPLQDLATQCCCTFNELISAEREICCCPYSWSLCFSCFSFSLLLLQHDELQHCFTGQQKSSDFLLEHVYSTWINIIDGFVNENNSVFCWRKGSFCTRDTKSFLSEIIFYCCAAFKTVLFEMYMKTAASVAYFTGLFPVLVSNCNQLQLLRNYVYLHYSHLWKC